MKITTKSFLFVAAMIAAYGATAMADVTGTVKFEGERPKRKIIKMNADPKCAAIHGDKKVGTENAIVSKDMEIANVFVYVKKGVDKQFDAPAEAVEINQEGCLYKPHVLGVLVGQTLNIRNSDNTLHNIHALPKSNPEFNFGQPAPGVRDKTFRKAEIGVKFKCDVHPWMGAWVHIMEHPYFGVSGTDGKFEIKGLPAGKYTIAAWHEEFGEVEQEVTVGDATEVNFTMSE